MLSKMILLVGVDTGSGLPTPRTTETGRASRSSKIRELAPSPFMIVLWDRRRSEEYLERMDEDSPEEGRQPNERRSNVEGVDEETRKVTMSEGVSPCEEGSDAVTHPTVISDRETSVPPEHETTVSKCTSHKGGNKTDHKSTAPTWSDSPRIQLLHRTIPKRTPPSSQAQR